MTQEFVENEHCMRCAQRHASVFCTAHADHLEEINLSRICSEYKKGQVIFNEGAHPFGLYCINEGKIKISHKGQDGREVIIRLAKPGDLMGYKALLSGNRYHASAVALEDCSVCFIPRDLILNIIKKDNSLSMGMLNLLSSQLRVAETQVAHLAQKPVRERLAEALLFIRETYGMEQDNCTLNVRLSRDEIANIVGTATESTIRLLSEFKKDGIIELEGKKIKVLDYNKLTRTANLQD